MKHVYKISSAIGGSALAMAFAVTMVSADTNLVNSGRNADINTSTTHNTNVTVGNTNSSFVNQTSVGISNTGGNSTRGNIGGGAVATGAANVSSDQAVMANQNQTKVTVPSVGSSAADSSIVNSGANLDLNASKTVNTNVNAVSANMATVGQFSLNVSNTGLNSSRANIGGGSIATGAATSNSLFDVEANINETTINLAGLANGVRAGNLDLTNTGRNADINNSLTVNHTALVFNTNVLMANQTALGFANTGLNATRANINGGSLATGAAVSGAEFDLMANKNTTGLSFGAGAEGGDVEAVNTGSDLDLNGSVTVNTTVSAISANTAVSAQSSVDVANSGVNTGNNNIDGGSMGTGSAGVWSGFMAGGNWNQTMF